MFVVLKVTIWCIQLVVVSCRFVFGCVVSALLSLLFVLPIVHVSPRLPETYPAAN